MSAWQRVRAHRICAENRPFCPIELKNFNTELAGADFVAARDLLQTCGGCCGCGMGWGVGGGLGRHIKQQDHWLENF